MDKKLKMATIISILSDQPIPNVSFIKEMAGPGDKHLFIATERTMETGIWKNIVDACDIKKDDFDVIVIDANSAQKIYRDLMSYTWDKTAHYIVNITGGNKLMSQMIFSFMTGFEFTTIYYYPIDSKVAQVLYPEIDEVRISNSSNLDLENYFRSFGYKFIKGEISKPIKVAEEMFDEVLKKKSVDDVQIIRKMLNIQGYHPDKPYYTGKWFEEYVYYKLKSELKLKDSEIGHNLKFKNEKALSLTESDLESDVVFIKNNKICIIECKVFRGIVRGPKLTNAFYKIASIGNKFGLRIPKYIIILGELSGDPAQNKRIEDLKKELGITDVFSLADFGTVNDPFKLILNTFK